MSHSGNAYINHLNKWKDLGFVNGWRENPKEYDACKAQGHKLIETNIGTCLNRWECPICKIHFDVDSSD